MSHLHNALTDPDSAKVEWLDQAGTHVNAPAVFKRYYYGYPDGRPKQIPAWELKAHINWKNLAGGYVGYRVCRVYWRDGKLIRIDVPG